MFSELAGHLAKMALFKVNTGLREHEVVNLRSMWEVPVPELDTSVFVIPRDYAKNGLDRYVALNRIAKSVIYGCRGEHSEFVFTEIERLPSNSAVRVFRHYGVGSVRSSDTAPRLSIGAGRFTESSSNSVLLGQKAINGLTASGTRVVRRFPAAC